MINLVTSYLGVNQEQIWMFRTPKLIALIYEARKTFKEIFIAGSSEAVKNDSSFKV